MLFAHLYIPMSGLYPLGFCLTVLYKLLTKEQPINVRIATPESRFIQPFLLNVDIRINIFIQFIYPVHCLHILQTTAKP